MPADRTCLVEGTRRRASAAGGQGSTAEGTAVADMRRSSTAAALAVDTRMAVDALVDMEAGSTIGEFADHRGPVTLSETNRRDPSGLHDEASSDSR